MTDTPKHKAVLVQAAEPGEECEHCWGTADACQNRKVGIYSIERGSGYVVACRQHAQEQIDEAIAEGDLYQEPA